MLKTTTLLMLLEPTLMIRTRLLHLEVDLWLAVRPPHQLFPLRQASLRLPPLLLLLPDPRSRLPTRSLPPWAI